MPLRHSAPSEEAPWSAFRQLASLRIRSTAPWNDILFEGLRQLSRLTELEASSPYGDGNHTFAGCTTALTGLRSLTLAKGSSSSVSTEATQCLTALSRLTRLCLGAIAATTGRSLRLPTTLVDLSLSFHQEPHLGTSQVLMSLPNLCSLEINSSGIMHLLQSDGVTPSCFFKRLNKLRALKTQNVVLCPHCLEALAAMSDLTELRFSEPKTHVDLDLIRALLSSPNLKVLRIPSPQLLIDQLMRGELKGCFPGLREFCFPGNCILDAGMQSALLKSFPCLRLSRHPEQTSTC